MRHLNRFFTVLALLSTTACSNQWRESDPGLTRAQVMSYLSDAQQSGTQSGSGSNAMTMVSDMQNDPNTTIYFDDDYIEGGSVASVLAFYNLDWLHAGPLSWQNIPHAQVFFLDQRTSEGHNNVLILGLAIPSGAAIKVAKEVDPATGVDTGPVTPTPPTGPTTPTSTGSAGLTYFAFSGQGTIKDGEFSALMSDGDSGVKLVVRTREVDGDKLTSVMQLRVYQLDESGNEYFLGKFSNLTGF